MKESSQVRIIGGKWRSRKITFLTETGVRPTSDRIRETLFNWLAPIIRGTRCLDLFAGTGALGFEALSRGAESVVMLDQSLLVVKSLRENVENLQAENCRIIHASVPNSVPILTPPLFDIIFLDPPFNQNLIAAASSWIEENKILMPEGFIYIEAEKTLSPLPIPDHWEVYRSKQAGNVGYHLLKRKAIC